MVWSTFIKKNVLTIVSYRIFLENQVLSQTFPKKNSTFKNFNTFGKRLVNKIATDFEEIILTLQRGAAESCYGRSLENICATQSEFPTNTGISSVTF